MASDSIKALGSEIAAALLDKSKAYRLATIDERMASSRTSGTVDYRLQAKREQIAAGDESVTWKFDVVEDGESVKIVSTAPADRGGIVADWGVITSAGKVGKDASSADVDLNDADSKAAFIEFMSHLGAHW